jgi:hypothetical protein
MPTATGRIELGPLDMTSSIELAEMATPERPLPPAIAEELAARSGGHPLLLRELARAAARGKTRTTSPRLLKSWPRVRSTSCHWRSVPCYGGLQSSGRVPRGPALQMITDVAPEKSGTELLAGLSGPHCPDRSPAPLPPPHSSGSRVRWPALSTSTRITRAGR